MNIQSKNMETLTLQFGTLLEALTMFYEFKPTCYKSGEQNRM